MPFFCACLVFGPQRRTTHVSGRCRWVGCPAPLLALPPAFGPAHCATVLRARFLAQRWVGARERPAEAQLRRRQLYTCCIWPCRHCGRLPRAETRLGSAWAALRAPGWCFGGIRSRASSGNAGRTAASALSSSSRDSFGWWRGCYPADTAGLRGNSDWLISGRHRRPVWHAPIDC